MTSKSTTQRTGYSIAEIRVLKEKINDNKFNALFLLENLVLLRILGRKLLVAPDVVIADGTFEDIIVREITLPAGKIMLQYSLEEK